MSGVSSNKAGWDVYDPCILTLSCDVNGIFPFLRGHRYISQIYKWTDENDEVKASRIVYYGDEFAVLHLVKDIQRLESMIDGLVTPVRVDLIEPVTVTSQCDAHLRNYALMELNPPTKTGRKPKYTMRVSFEAFEPTAPFAPIDNNLFPGNTGATGTIEYCQDGSVGKASINYWNNHVHKGYSWAIVDGELVISKTVD